MSHVCMSVCTFSAMYTVQKFVMCNSLVLFLVRITLSSKQRFIMKFLFSLLTHSIIIYMYHLLLDSIYVIIMKGIVTYNIIYLTILIIGSILSARYYNRPLYYYGNQREINILIAILLIRCARVLVSRDKIAHLVPMAMRIARLDCT